MYIFTPTEEQSTYIVDKYSTENMSSVELAKEFNVHPSTMLKFLHKVVNVRTDTSLNKFSTGHFIGHGHSVFDARPSWKSLGRAAVHLDDAGRVVVGDLRQALYRGCQSPFPGAGGHPTPASDRLQCHPVEAAGMASDAHALKSARPCPKIEPSRPRKGVRFPSTARFKESPAKATI